MDEGDGARNLYYDRIIFEEDLGQVTAMLRERRLLYRREFLEPQGFAHGLGGVFVDGSAWGKMGLARGTGDLSFGEREVDLVKRVAPHVGAGLKAAALRSRAATADQGTGDVPGVLTLDRFGNVVSHTPSAERW